MGRIPPIRIPQPIIREVPPPITTNVPPLRIPAPVVDVPNPVIEYPVIDVPTRENFEGMLPIEEEQTQTEEEETRELPPPTTTPQAPPPSPVIEVGGIEVPVPPVAPLITAGATAVVVASVTMGATLVLNQVKDSVIGPLLERMKRKKIKIKQKKPVIQYIVVDGGVSVFEINVKSMKHLRLITNVEQDLRDQIEIDSLYEFDNKIIIDSSLKDSMTKEGQKRFKKHFCPSSTIVKKLSARFSF